MLSWPSSLCFLDLDLFRNVNNTHGYAAGDQLLVSVFQRLRERLRASDGVFRWGGEEFVVLAPDQAALGEFGERLRLLVANEPFTIDGRRLRVTCSVGAARLDEAREPEEALRRPVGWCASRSNNATRSRRRRRRLGRPHGNQLPKPSSTLHKSRGVGLGTHFDLARSRRRGRNRY